MSLLRRPPLILLLWLALAWLPLRGLAQVTMHLAPAAAATAAEAPCHGGADHGSHDASVEGAGVDINGASACSLCDLCHGSALPAPMLSMPTAWAPPQVATEPRLHGLVAPPHFERPPRI